MKKYGVILLAGILWLCSMFILIRHVRFHGAGEKQILEEDIEIPVSFTKTLVLSFKEKPFAVVNASLVPNRFKEQMLYYLHIEARAELLYGQSLADDVTVKGYFLFRSSYELLRFNLDISERQGTIRISGKQDAGEILLSALLGEGGPAAQIRVKSSVWKELIKTVLAGTESIPGKIIDNKMVFGDYELLVYDNKTEVELTGLPAEQMSGLANAVLNLNKDR